MAQPSDLIPPELEATLSTLLAHPVPPPRAASPPYQPWASNRPPRGLQEVTDRFNLTQAELKLLRAQGFVVLPRVKFSSYPLAFREIFQSELPLFVSADAIWHAVYVSHREITAALESDVMLPHLTSWLSTLHAALPDWAPFVPQELAHGLDLYLTVAAQLLDPYSEQASHFGLDAQIASLVHAINAAEEVQWVEMWGRGRHIDFSRYAVRGHYAQQPGLDHYFRAMTWLMNVEFNLVSRTSRSSVHAEASDPRETPQEALTALALAELNAAHPEAAQHLAALNTFVQVWTGPREDLSLTELHQIRLDAGINDLADPSAFPALKATLGDRFQRVTPLHMQAQSHEVPYRLPVIASAVGPRPVADARVLRHVVNDATPSRLMLGAGDVAYVLGFNEAAPLLLAEDRAQFPMLDLQLNKARQELVDVNLAARTDLYSRWLHAIDAIDLQPQGQRPSFMGTTAWRHAQMNSALVAFGQLRRNYVLMAGQVYPFGGCAHPDGFVEPVPEVYQRLLAYAQAGANLVRHLDPEGTTDYADHFHSLGRILMVLDTLARLELSGEPLPKAALDFFNSTVERLNPSGESGDIATFDGWYFHTFFPADDSLRHVAFESPAFIADYFGSPEADTVAYLGAGLPQLGVFVIDSGGEPRVMVGPVARGFAATSSLSERASIDQSPDPDNDAYDEEGDLVAVISQPLPDRLPLFEEPWAAAYTVPPVALPTPIHVNVLAWNASNVQLVVTSSRRVRGVQIELLDHHRRPRITRTVTSKPGGTKLTLDVSKYTVTDGPNPKHNDGPLPLEMLRVRFGEASATLDLFLFESEFSNFKELLPETYSQWNQDQTYSLWLR